MEHEHNFYGVNFAPFPHRGVLSSENAHRSMATMVEATAANWVILSPSGIQSDPYSEEINWNTNATPTDEELCGAIRFAKQLGLQVALKPTVNCANGVWRARISFFDHDPLRCSCRSRRLRAVPDRVRNDHDRAPRSRVACSHCRCAAAISRTGEL